jgi:lysophospholipase L1-like esterase
MPSIPRRTTFALPLLAALPARAETPMAAKPLSRDIAWWQKRHHDKLDELAQKKPALIFLGDSITQDWEVDKDDKPFLQFVPGWKRFYGDRNAVNLGFNGDATCHLLWRIDNGEVSGYTPKAAVMLIGANNLGRLHWSAADTIAGIGACLTALRNRQPTTKILLLGVLPSIRSDWATETTLAINRGLAARYRDASVATYMDVGHIFMKNGKVDPDMFIDPLLTPPQKPLHPTPQAQNLISAAIEPTLSRMLGDHPHA